MTGTRKPAASKRGHIFAAVILSLAVTLAFAASRGEEWRGGDHEHRHRHRHEINHAPTAASAAIATNEDTTSAPAIPSVTDPDEEDTYTFAIVTQPANGAAAVIDNALVYTPNLNFNGLDSFTFSATDSGGLGVIGTASVTVNPVDDAPTAANVNIVTDEDTQSAPVTPAVTDVDSGDTYSVSIDSPPAHGVASVSSNQLIYTPSANYNGADTFTFRVTDSGGLSGVAMAIVTINPVNDPPTFASASIVTDEDTASAAVAPNVDDPDAGDTFTFAIVSQPRNGSASVTNNRLVYTPELNYTGADGFTFSATDTSGLAVTGTAAVTVAPVNDPPSATGGGRPVFSSLSGSRTPWVDDVDIGDAFTFQPLTPPTNGTALVGASQWTYTPTPPFTSGTDNFTYQATDSGGATITGTAKVRVFNSTMLTVCRRVSTVNTNGTLNVRTRSDRCAFYDVSTTRTGPSGPITMDYILNWPANTTTPVGVVVLIGGSDLSSNIVGDATTGLPSDSGGNFLVRSAQLFADAGFVTIAIDRPSDQPPEGSTDIIGDVDQYRISVKHAVDILTVLKHVNTNNLPVFLVGTSRGAISAVANNLIATGIAVSSSVTNGGGNPARLYVGRADVPGLQPSFVQRPAHVLWHQNDLCSLSTPAGSQTLYNNLTAAGVAAAFSIASGGTRVTAPATDVDVCGAFDFHGYFGIEPTAAGYVTDWLLSRVSALAGDHPPQAAFITVPTAAGASKQIDLGALARDADGDTLSYALSHGTTTLGGSVTLNGTLVTYTPPVGATNTTDSFVYVVTDGRGGVGAAVISVQIGS